MNKQLLKNMALSVLITTTSYAYSADNTPCINIVDHFNKAALAALFSNKQNLQINLTSSSPVYGSVGCFVQTNISYSGGFFNQVNKDIGSILVYQMPDSQQIYQGDKQLYMPVGARLNWQGILPNVVEGYLSNAMDGYKAFNAYLTNGVYVVFIYIDTPSDPSTITKLNQAFVDYINVMATQVISAPK